MTPIEESVLRMLSAIEVSMKAADAILARGNGAVTATCDIALGNLPGIRAKVRGNAVALLGRMDRPQVRETLALLARDSSPDIRIRAFRSAGRLKAPEVVDALGAALRDSATPPVVAAEAALALDAMATPEALSLLERYRVADDAPSHRDTTTVKDAMARTTRRL
jgi:HEAT repeat protein